MRFRSYHLTGREFRRAMEITWFGLRVLRGTDAYVDGEGSLRTSGLVNTSGTRNNFDQGQNLAMWAEAPVTTPSVLVLDPRVRWEPIDAHAALLIVPFGEVEEALRAGVESETGLIESMSSMRYRGQEESKTPGAGSTRSGGCSTG